MAQPLLPQNLLRRRFDIYVNSDELSQIGAKARQTHLPISTFVRTSALAQKIQAPPTEASIQRWQQLARVSANLNQIAHAIASGKATGVDIATIEDLAEQVRLTRLELLGTTANWCKVPKAKRLVNSLAVCNGRTSTGTTTP